MDKIEVNKLLSKINYPGFSRDIVSFGMVSNIQIDSDNVLINLKITSQNEEKKAILVKNIEEKLSEYFSLVKVKIDEIDKNVPSGNFLFFSYPFMKYNSNQYIIPMHADKKIVINTLIGPNHKPRIHINWISPKPKGSFFVIIQVIIYIKSKYPKPTSKP